MRFGTSPPDLRLGRCAARRLTLPADFGDAAGSAETGGDGARPRWSRVSPRRPRLRGLRLRGSRQPSGLGRCQSRRLGGCRSRRSGEGARGAGPRHDAVHHERRPAPRRQAPADDWRPAIRAGLRAVRNLVPALRVERHLAPPSRHVPAIYRPHLRRPRTLPLLRNSPPPVHLRRGCYRHPSANPLTSPSAPGHPTLPVHFGQLLGV